MSNQNVHFIYDNQNFDAATLSATHEDPAWPITNAQVDDVGDAFKTTELGETDTVIINVDFTQLQMNDVLVFAHHDLHAESTVTVRTFADAARTEQLYEQLFYGYRALFGFGERGFGEGGFGGVPVQEDLNSFPRMTRAFYFDEPQNERYYQIEIDNAGQQFSIGRIFLSSVLAPKLNYIYGDTFELEDDTTTVYAAAGNAIREEGEQYYQMSFTLPYLGRGEAYGEFIRFLKHCGKRKPFVVHRDPNELDDAEPYSIFYGSFIKIPQFKSIKKTRSIQAPFVIREEL